MSQLKKGFQVVYLVALIFLFLFFSCLEYLAVRILRRSEKEGRPESIGDWKKMQRGF